VEEKDRCIKCNHEISKGAKFCPECGEKQEVVCNNCGAKLSPGTKFCSECGTKVE